MRHSINTYTMILLGMIMLIVFPAMAQTTTPASGWNPPPMDQWFGSMESVYSAIVVIGGYLSAKIPGLNKINNATYRVLAFATLVAAGFWYFGANIWGLAISYVFSTSFYEVVLKALGANSPQTQAQKAGR